MNNTNDKKLKDLPQFVKDQYNNMTAKGDTVLLLGDFGSELYGTTTENSDSDYVIVYIPSLTCYIGQDMPKDMTYVSTSTDASKNTSDDIDVVLITLYGLLYGAAAGDMKCIDTLMIDVHENAYVWNSAFCDNIQSKSHLLINKDMPRFYSYLKDRVYKYGVVGFNLDNLGALIDYIESSVTAPKTPIGEHSLSYWKDIMGVDLTIHDTHIVLCGREYPLTTTKKYLIKQLKQLRTTAGNRNIETMDSDSIAWKDIYHAVRSCWVVESWMNTRGNTIYPLTDHEISTLLNIKGGDRDPSETIEYLKNKFDRLKQRISVMSIPDKLDKDLVYQKILEPVVVFQHIYGMKNAQQPIL